MRETNDAAREAGQGQSPEEELRLYIGVFLHRVLAPGSEAVHRLITREMNDPTPALDIIVELKSGKLRNIAERSGRLQDGKHGLEELRRPRARALCSGSMRCIPAGSGTMRRFPERFPLPRTSGACRSTSRSVPI